MSEFQIDVVNPPGSQRVEYIPVPLLWPLGGDRFDKIVAGKPHLSTTTLIHTEHWAIVTMIETVTVTLNYA